MKTNNVVKKGISLLLCLAMVLTYTVGFGDPMIVDAAVDVGANPTPKIDIAVNVPSDYPGTFLDYKQELTQKLKDQGLDPSLFRITSTAVSIDTTSMNGWYVYDHYRDDSTYTTAVPADQRTLQPKRITVDGNMGGGYNNIANVVDTSKDKFKISAVNNLDRHIYIYKNVKGASNMAFAGYGTKAYSDFMIYPASSSSTRTFSFNIDASIINPHTLTGFGFLMNAGIINGKVSGYLLYFDAGQACNNAMGAVSIKQINGANPIQSDGNNETPAFTQFGAMTGSSASFSLGAQKKVRLTVELKKDSLTVQQQAYDASGNLGEVQDVLRDFKIPQFASETLNGLGPWVGYTSHGCTGFSSIIYSDLEMTYEASAFDALKYVQYYQGAEYKYFVNLAGASNNPGIPADGSEDYLDGINRMNNSEIFYVSNAQDGKIVTDSAYEKNADGSLKLDELGNPILAKDEDGNIIHQGLGASNGCIATSDDYVGQMAEFIAKNYFEENHFKKAEISSELPLASFYVKNVDGDQQLMTIHLKHLQLQNEEVKVNIHDKSKIGTASGKDGKLTGYKYAVYDPNGKKVVNTDWLAGPDAIPDYRFTKDSTSGTYVFELTVRDDKGNESKTFQKYLTAYLDDEVPYIEGRNETKNKATITLTDTGEGIDEDGITFIKDGRGSGVAAYWVTNDPDAAAADAKWTVLDAPVHSYEFDVDINSTEPIVVWVKDECGNIGKQEVFQPTHVSVQDKDGNPIDDYYVIGDKPIIVLPDDDVVPPSDDKEEYHSGWETPGGQPVTPGTTPDPDENHEIIIRPDYSKDQAAMVYMANGGKIDGKDSSSYKVTAGSSILTKIGDHNVIPKREGYTFKGWKLLNSHIKSNAENSDYINNPVNVEEIKEQQATASNNGGNNLIENDYYYLIAQWEVSKYKLTLDANGGSLGNVRAIENVPYKQDLTAADISQDDGVQTIPIKDRGVPTKPGYVFQGWSESKDNDTSKIFKFASGIAGTPTTVPTMPASDKTVYAVWKTDTNKFIVSFDSNGGNKISDQAYVANATNYNPFSEPSRVGYTFDGWYHSEELTDITHEDKNGILVFNDGVVDKPIAYKGGETITKKKAHEFVAMWTPNQDTNYTVEYYIREKDDQGKFSYTKVSEKTKTYSAPTETVVKLDPNIIDPEGSESDYQIKVNGRIYQYDVDNENNVLEGVVTGNPALSLKLYYKGYYNVFGNIDKGSDETMGTVTSALDQEEGSTPTVTWSAKPGYYVSKVVVDGNVRDDLLYEGKYTLESGIYKDHNVWVTFAQGAGAPVKGVYKIKTVLNGCSDGSCTISPSENVQKGGEVTLEWNIGNGYKLKDSPEGILLDGVEFKTDSNKLKLKGIQADHTLVVNVEKIENEEEGKPEPPPTLGGETTDGYYTVTVNRYGGNGDCYVSESTTKIVKGDNYNLKWYSDDNYDLHEIFIDGEKYEGAKDAAKEKPGIYQVPVNGNVVIDVYFKEKDKDPIDFKEDADEYIKVTTQVVGGPGTITGGAVLKKGDDYQVDWTAGGNNTANPDDTDYSYYEIVSVTVDGERKSVQALTGDLTLENLTEDARVVVEVAPVLYDIGLHKYGEGSISASRQLFKGQYYTGIEAKAKEGSSIVKIVVDEEVIYDTVTEDVKVEMPPTVEELVTKTNEIPATDESSAPDEAADSTDAENDLMVMAENDGSDTSTITQTIYKGSVKGDNITTVMNNHKDLNINSNINSETFTMSVTGALEDHNVEVYFTKDPEDGIKGSVTPAPSKDDLVRVFATVVGYEGSEPFFTGMSAGEKVSGVDGFYKKGDSPTVRWGLIPEGYDLVGVTVNGTAVSAKYSWDFQNLQQDQNLVVTLKKQGGTNKPLEPTLKETNYTIDTELYGGAGTISGSAGTILQGAKGDVTWTVTDPEHYEVKSITVNGLALNDPQLLDKMTITAGLSVIKAVVDGSTK